LTESQGIGLRLLFGRVLTPMLSRRVLGSDLGHFMVSGSGHVLVEVEGQSFLFDKLSRHCLDQIDLRGL